MTSLSATTTVEQGRVVFTCAGSAETDTIEQLASTLDGVHTSALQQSAREVVADLRALEFASSSCLKEFVTWLSRVQALEGDQRYHVRFKSNPQHSWQRRSLVALAAFAGDVVKIETEAT